MLLAFLFVLAPAMDALYCKGEQFVTTSIAMDVTPGDDTQLPAPDSHVICPHGHCHHVVPMTSTVAAVDQEPISSPPEIAWISSAFELFNPSSRERPPRA